MPPSKARWTAQTASFTRWHLRPRCLIDTMKCAPDTPSWLCITATELQAALYLIFPVLLILGVAAIIISERKKRFGPRLRNRAPDGRGSDDQHIISWSEPNGPLGKSGIYTVPSDPQAFARIFVPKGASRDQSNPSPTSQRQPSTTHQTQPTIKPRATFGAARHRPKRSDNDRS